MRTSSPQKIARLQNMVAAAQQARQSGLHAQAINLLRDVLREAPDANDVKFQLALLLATTRQLDEAASLFRSILKGNPAHAATRVNLANVLMEIEQIDEAVKEYRRALALDPKMVWAHAHLGVALRKAGELEDAIKAFKQALDLDGKNAFAFNGLGLIYRDMEDIPRALECFEHAVGLMPTNADFRMNYGYTLNNANMPDLAVEQYYEAARLRPDMLEAVVLLGEILQDLRRFDDAKECFDRALVLKPAEPELFERRGFVYLDMGDTEHALKDFDHVLVQDADRSMALLGKGRSHMEAGDDADAVANLEKLVNLYPEVEAGYFYLANSHKFKPEDPIIPKLEALAGNADDKGEASPVLHFALGKILDDCKQWDEAFAHYARGNQLRNEDTKYNPDNDAALFTLLIEVFSPEFLAAHQDCGTANNLPVIIVGMPRSGTTLTEQIISSHPQVIGAGEVEFWGKVFQSMPLTLGTDISYPQCMEKITPDKAHGVAERYIHLLRKIAGPETHPDRITDKMPHNFMNLGLIAMLFPNAPIVHCRRNPMDNCLSIFFQSFGPGHGYAYDLANLGHHYKQYERIMAHWHKVLPGRILDINYEDTIADPEFWSRKLIEHVGLEWDDACLAPHKLERTVKTASHWQVRQPIYKTSVQRWKNYGKHLGPLKTALGYTG